MSIALEKNSRQRFLYGETSTAPEQRRPEAIVLCFCFISELLMLQPHVQPESVFAFGIVTKLRQRTAPCCMSTK